MDDAHGMGPVGYSCKKCLWRSTLNSEIFLGFLMKPDSVNLVVDMIEGIAESQE